jgi:hypothetical protein
VDPIPDPLVLRKSGSTENPTRTSGSIARNSDHYTTEAVGIVHSRTQVMVFFYFLMQAHTVVNQVQEETEAQNVHNINVHS